jgi:hypothetical protein
VLRLGVVLVEMDLLLTAISQAWGLQRLWELGKGVPRTHRPFLPSTRPNTITEEQGALKVNLASAATHSNSLSSSYPGLRFPGKVVNYGIVRCVWRAPRQVQVSISQPSS